MMSWTSRALRWSASALLAAALTVVSTGVRDARADGAFPNPQGILLPAGKPGVIYLITNFGVISTSDAGKTWLWSCEQDLNAFGQLYQLGGAAQDRMFALVPANNQIVFSDDGTCGWQVASVVGDRPVVDYFLDPSNPARAVAVGMTDAGYDVLESVDGGHHFSNELFSAPVDQGITGVEIARSDPKTIYVALTASSSGGAVSVARTADGGTTWTTSDLTARLGSGGTLKIISVDPQDAKRVLFLFVNTTAQYIVLTTDGGVTSTMSLALHAVFTSFTRLQSGTLLLSGVATDGTALLYRSRDRGVSFQALSNAPDMFGMAERDGRVYAATNSMTVKHAIATSDDEGSTWKPFMTFMDVKAILPCVKATCQTGQNSCAAEVALEVWPANVCSADPPAAGSAGTGGNGGGGTGGAGSGSTGPKSSSGGGCDIVRAPTAWSSLLVTLAVTLLLLAGRRKSSPPQ